MNYIDDRELLAYFPLLLNKGEVAKLKIPINENSFNIHVSLQTSDDGEPRYELKGGTEFATFKIFNVFDGVVGGRSEPIIIAESGKGNKVYLQFLIHAMPGETKHVMLQFTHSNVGK